MNKTVVPDQTLIGLFGPPGSGKSTIAEIIAKKTGAKHWDIDDIRVMLFGQPAPNDGTDALIDADRGGIRRTPR